MKEVVGATIFLRFSASYAPMKASVKILTGYSDYGISFSSGVTSALSDSRWLGESKAHSIIKSIFDAPLTTRVHTHSSSPLLVRSYISLD